MKKCTKRGILFGLLGMFFACVSPGFALMPGGLSSGGQAGGRLGASDWRPRGVDEEIVVATAEFAVGEQVNQGRAISLVTIHKADGKRSGAYFSVRVCIEVAAGENSDERSFAETSAGSFAARSVSEAKFRLESWNEVNSCGDEDSDPGAETPHPSEAGEAAEPQDDENGPPESEEPQNTENGGVGRYPLYTTDNWT